MANGFKELIQFIATGEPVSPGTPNRVTRDLDGNIRFLRDLLEAAEIGEALFARDVTLEAETLIGAPVYWDGSSQSFKRGLAQVETDLATGQVVTAASAQIWGVVSSKENSTLGCVLLSGVATLDISNVISGDVESATYYLSAVTPGGLTPQRPPVTVPVLIADGEGKVLVNTQITDFLHDHVHFKFDLVAAPSGETAPPAPGGQHTIVNPDNTIEGWLPADDAIFGGKAPDGSFFGYNISANSQLTNLWPPVPVAGAVLEWDKALDKDLGFMGVADALVIMDRNGIWWMSDCEGDVPWPVDLNTSTSDSISEPTFCPRELTFALRVWFNKLSFLTDQSVVTSLATDDNRIQLLCETDPTLIGRTGPILIRLALEFLLDQDNVRGNLAIKEFDGVTNKFNRGPIAEGLYALSSNVNLTGESSQVMAVAAVDRTVFQGAVGISVDVEGTQELSVDLIRLDGATEEFFEEVPYIELPDDELTRIRSVINIPATLALVNPKLRIRLRVLGRAAGTLPALTLTGRRLPRNEAGAEALPLVDSAIVMTTTGVVVANEYREFTSDEITVVAGDQYVFTVERDDADGYTGALGILQQVGLVSAGA